MEISKLNNITKAQLAMTVNTQLPPNSLNYIKDRHSTSSVEHKNVSVKELTY